MNAYVTVDLMKSDSVLDIDGTGDDTRLRLLAEAMSRWADRYTGRHFYVLSATRKFDGDGDTKLLLPFDLISIDSSGLKTDDNKDRTFETTWATTDYLLGPSYADPTTRENPESAPYWKIEIDPSGNEDVFTAGRETLQIAGKWGYWQHVARASETITAADGTGTTLAVSSRTDVEAGHTLLVESEQIYVKSYSANDLTVVRGVNGTTGAAHSAGTAVDIYEYPDPVRESVMLNIARLMKRADAGFASGVVFPDGSRLIYRGLDPDIGIMLDMYKRL